MNIEFGIINLVHISMNIEFGIINLVHTSKGSVMYTFPSSILCSITLFY